MARLLQHGRDKKVSVHLPCRKKSLGKARSTVQRLANADGFDPDDAEDIALAAQEALKNIIQHACPADNTMRFTVSSLGDRLVVEVSDRGQGFDVETLEEEPSSPMALHGRGIQLIKGLMDDVSIRSNQTGTVVHMEKMRR